MSMLQQILGKDDLFYDLLEAAAQEARTSVTILDAFVSNPSQPMSLEPFSASRRKEKQIVVRLTEALCTNFVTSLDANDIEALCVALYRIPKTVEMIAERLLLAPQHLAGLDLKPQLAMIDKASSTVLTMSKMLRKGVRPDQIKPLNAELQFIEGEADKMVVESLRTFYAGKTDVFKAVFVKDLFELMEKVTDKCRDAGNIMNRIALKNT
jgi:uncharacterized protein Yka (UPF0111/DUF47 family)